MKKALVLIMAIGLAVALLAITGCGSDSTTIQTPAGEVTVEEGDGTITFEGEGGEGTLEMDTAPTEAELGAAVYPGAEYVPGSGMSMTGSSQEGVGGVVTASFSTKDSFDEVVDWYTNELGQEAFAMSTEGVQEASWFLGDEEMESINVTVTVEDGDVVILIYRVLGE